jgi:hypothetical protein
MQLELHSMSKSENARMRAGMQHPLQKKALHPQCCQFMMFCLLACICERACNLFSHKALCEPKFKKP